MGIYKHSGVIALLIGAAAVICLANWSGIDSVGHAFASVGWGILAVVLVRTATVSIAGTGWWLLFPGKRHPEIGTCIFLRFIREAGNVLLPLTQIGGDVIGARLMAVGGVPGSLAAASIVVDVLLQATTQLVFAVLGCAVLVALGAGAALTQAAAIGLAVATVMLGGFYLAQRRVGQRILQWGLSRLIGDQWRVVGTIDAVYESLSGIYARRGALLASGITHLIGWFVGVAEVLAVFAFMGNPVGLAEAFVIESLLQAIRGAAFAVPSALGAQEGGLILLCAIFGIPSGEAIALSLVKRAADLMLGGPSLLGWQVLEWGRLMPKYSPSQQRHCEPIESCLRDQ